jgi:hypothetical protein
MHIFATRLAGGSARHAALRLEAEGGAGPATPSVPSPATRQSESFSREYVQELREENRSWRLKLQEAETARQAASDLAARAERETDAAIEAAKQAAIEEARAQGSEVEKALKERLVLSELRSVALKAGMVDLDGLKLADLSSVALDERHELSGADELVARLKEAKPYLFTRPSPGSSNPEPPPKPGDKTPKMAKDMTEAERTEFLRQHKARFR